MKNFLLLTILIPNILFGQRVDEILANMSLEQKIGQLHQIDGRTDLEKLKAEIRKGNISSIMNICDAAVIDELQRIAVEESPSKMPIIFSRDVVHGFKTVLPIPLGQACSFDERLIEIAARNTALEATENGIRWAFAPMMDVARDPRWGRVAEGFGEDPFLTSKLSVAVVKGYQGESLSDPKSMAACAKHFVGYSATEGGRDYNTTYIPVRSLYDTYFPPFKACVDAGIASFMSSFNDNDGVPATGNKWLLTDVLRTEWGFDGVVVSDWGSVAGLIPHGVAANKKEAAATCLEAGLDMDMMSYSYLNHLKELIENGTVSEKLLDRAVRRVLEMKEKLGLLDNPYTRKSESSDVYSKQVLSDAQALTESSMVLLKNDGVLPLKNVKKIVVAGPMADAPYDQMGTWTLDGEKAHTITPIAALREKFNVDYYPALTYPRDSTKRDWKKMLAAAKKADAVVVFVGEEQIMSGEAHSLSNLDLQGLQAALISELAATGTPLVTVIMAGRPLTIAKQVEESNALLYAWHPGTMGGAAIARILNGEVNPSGRLSITFPRNVGQIPIYYNKKHTSHIAKGTEGNINKIGREIAQSVMGHTSSYLDVSPSPLYPFGYGLSYTDYEYSNLKISDDLTVSVDVTNTGSVAGVETVQIYTGRSVASATQPMKQLKGFVRVALEPGQTKTVTYRIKLDDLKYCTKDMRFTVEPGKYVLTVGHDSTQGLKQNFSIF